MSSQFVRLWERRGVRQLMKFGIVGIVNLALDWVVFFLIKSQIKNSTQILKQLAKAISFSVSGSSSYFMNRHWTFRSRDRRVARQMMRFFIVAGIGLIINNALFYVLTAPTLLHQSDIIGLMGGSAIVAGWNFILNKYWTFREDEPKGLTT